MALIKIQPFNLNEDADYTFNAVTTTANVNGGNLNAVTSITRNSRNVPVFVYEDGIAPESPLVGDQWYDTSTGILFEYVDDGITAAWVDMNGLPGIILTNNATVDTLIVSNTITVYGNTITGGIKTDNYFYANGEPFSGGGGGGGNGVPGGSNTQIQFNNNGNFGATANFKFNSSTNLLTLVGSANLGNSVTANYFTGTLTTHAQPNITSVGSLANLTVTGNVTLGNVSNVHITGGTASQFLQTDGTGNLIWATVTSGGGFSSAPVLPVVDDFTGDDETTTFTLSQPPTNINQTSVNYNGSILLRDSYTIDGANLTFTSPPAFGSHIEVTTTYPGNQLINGNSNVSISNSSGNITMTVADSNVVTVTSTGVIMQGTSNLGPASNVTVTGGSPGQFLSTDANGALVWSTVQSGSTAYVDSFVGDGTATDFELSVIPGNINLTTVNYNGSTLLRDTYTLSNANVIFSSPPADGAAIEITVLRSGNTGEISALNQFASPMQVITGATGNVVHDMSNVQTFYHQSVTSNFTPNFTNVSTTSSQVITAKVLINQGSTSHVPTTGIQLEGVPQSVKWLAGITPTGSASNIDSITYQFVRVATTWVILAEYTTYS